MSSQAAAFESDCGVFTVAWMRSAARYDANFDPDEAAKAARREFFLKSIQTQIDIFGEGAAGAQNFWSPSKTDVLMTIDTARETALHNRKCFDEDREFSLRQNELIAEGLSNAMENPKAAEKGFVNLDVRARGNFVREIDAKMEGEKLEKEKRARLKDANGMKIAQSAGDVAVAAGGNSIQQQEESPSCFLQGAGFGPDVESDVLQELLLQPPPRSTSSSFSSPSAAALLVLDFNRLQSVRALSLCSRTSLQNLRCLSLRENRIASVAGLFDNPALNNLVALDLGRNLIQRLGMVPVDEPAAGVVQDSSAARTTGAVVDVVEPTSSDPSAALSPSSTTTSTVAVPVQLLSSPPAVLTCTLKSLRVLILKENRLGPSIADALDVMLPASLSALDLSANLMSTGGLEDLQNAIGCGGGNLQTLDLSSNDLKETQRHYRRRFVAGFPDLRMLDQQPVGFLERACSEAWVKGGADAEAKVRRSATNAAKKMVAKVTKKNTVPPRMQLKMQQQGAARAAEQQTGDANGYGPAAAEVVPPITMGIPHHVLVDQQKTDAEKRNPTVAWALPGSFCALCNCTHPAAKPYPSHQNPAGSTPKAKANAKPKTQIKKYDNTGSSGYEHVEELTVGWRVMPEHLKPAAAKRAAGAGRRRSEASLENGTSEADGFDHHEAADRVDRVNQQQHHPPAAARPQQPKPTAASAALQQRLEIAKKRERTAEQALRDALSHGAREIRKITAPDWRDVPRDKLEGWKPAMLAFACVTLKPPMDDKELVDVGLMKSPTFLRMLAEVSVAQLLSQNNAAVFNLLAGEGSVLDVGEDVDGGSRLQEDEGTRTNTLSPPLSCLRDWSVRLCRAAAELQTARAQSSEAKQKINAARE